MNMETSIKYPRTSYLEFSPQFDKNRVHSNIKHFINKDIIISEKIDGSNTLLHAGKVYDRSTNTEYKWHGMV